MPSPSAPIPPAPLPRQIDASWRRWIVEQRLGGSAVESMLQMMQGAGLARTDAERAIAALDDDPAYAVALSQKQRLRKLDAVALNLQRLWASDPQYRTVEKRANLSDEEFAARYVRGCRPVVLTGHTRDWPAMRRWSPEDLKRRFGHLDVDVQSERHADPNYEQNKLLLTKRLNLGAFVDRVVQGGATNDYYLTANNELLRRPEFAPLLDDIGSLPPLCDRSQLTNRSSFWFGPAGTVTPLHHDTLMLFHTQVVGRKRWRFVSPLEWSRVYNLRNVFSDVDLERPDPARFPAFADATVLEVVVEPGETMFLPLGWWHQVASLDVSLSFSYSCLAVPNQFDYPDPAPPLPAPPAATSAHTADAMQGELLNAVSAVGGIIEAQFKDGSTLRFRSRGAGMEVQESRTGSRASHYGQQLAGISGDGGAIQCQFTDGSSIRIVPFG
ncbi:cupin-like domain-containing protein [Variovorax sp. RT4R15]|uniref:cupin-like domain-containing protein n=1 Tax=Variovorax sp. RT4R15 TaxID=3443737 RepID=UPI003F447B5B